MDVTQVTRYGMTSFHKENCNGVYTDFPFVCNRRVCNFWRLEQMTLWQIFCTIVITSLFIGLGARIVTEANRVSIEMREFTYGY